MKRLSIILAALLVSGSAIAAPVENKVAVYQKLDEICRGGDPSIEAVNQACKMRSTIAGSINRDGLCYGTHSQSRSDYAWHKCGKNSVKITGWYR